MTAHSSFYNEEITQKTASRGHAQIQCPLNRIIPVLLTLPTIQMTGTEEPTWSDLFSTPQMPPLPPQPYLASPLRMPFSLPRLSPEGPV